MIKVFHFCVSDEQREKLFRLFCCVGFVSMSVINFVKLVFAKGVAHNSLSLSLSLSLINNLLSLLSPSASIFIPLSHSFLSLSEILLMLSHSLPLSQLNLMNTSPFILSLSSTINCSDQPKGKKLKCFKILDDAFKHKNLFCMWQGELMMITYIHSSSLIVYQPLQRQTIKHDSDLTSCNTKKMNLSNNFG